jgi:hypothetical protein
MTLGDGGLSVLYDVAIINDTLVYAVGEIYVTGDEKPFNLAMWNGASWSLQRIMFYTICGQSNTTPYPAKSILAFGPSDIWVALEGGQVARWNGISQSGLTCDLPIAIRRMWGVSSRSIFAVGSAGGMIHYDGTSWTKIETGTDVDLNDIWGKPDGTELWTCGYTPDHGQSVLLRIKNKVSDVLWHRVGTSGQPPFGFLAMSLWGKNNLFLAADSVFRVQNWNADLLDPMLPLNSFYYRLRGNAENNLFLVGDNSDIIHFNGQSWRKLRGEDALESFYSVAVTPKLTVAVGIRYDPINSKALIAIVR